MSEHRFHDDATLDAALYLLGCLSGVEAAAYEQHVAGCSDCAAEAAKLEGSAAALAALVPVVDPPAELRARLLERVAALRPDATVPAQGLTAGPEQAWRQWTATPTGGGPVFVPAGGGAWEPTGVGGVTAKRLFVDPKHDRVTLLVRMAPGTSYPAHRHGGPEECYLLEGDLDDGEVRLRAGDYLRRDGGSFHGVHSSMQGCLMLISSSLHDELLETVTT
ncbi:MAG: cupin domain-containing protein [Thermoanaerobaculales bacterium]